MAGGEEEKAAVQKTAGVPSLLRKSWGLSLGIVVRSLREAATHPTRRLLSALSSPSSDQSGNQTAELESGP